MTFSAVCGGGTSQEARLVAPAVREAIGRDNEAAVVSGSVSESG
jgi:hypothetical protein